MTKEDKNKKSIPKWVGAHPFCPEDKKPVVITKDREISTLYGFEGFQVQSQLFVSTDKLTFTDWVLPPGMRIEPPGMHNYGDEIYYFIEGDAIAFDPEKGEAYQVHPGDTLLIPQGTRHQVFNFTNKRVYVLSIVAPKIWVEDEIGVKIPLVKKSEFYKS